MDAKYYAYRNLRTGGFSIKHKGIVIERPDVFVMTNVSFNVSQAGRDRAIKEKQRNVHAYLVSDNYEVFDFGDDRYVSIGCHILNNDMFTEVTYNPFHLKTFVTKDNKIPVTWTDYVVFIDDKVYMRTKDINNNERKVQ